MVTEQQRREGLLEAYDFKIQPRAAFEAEASAKLVARAKEYLGAFVLWDPIDDEDGFMLVGASEQELRDDWHHNFPEL